MIADLIPLIIMGGLAGGASSILGIGGGIFIVPLLPIFTEIEYREAVATSLMMIFLLVSVNSYFFHRKSLIGWKTVCRVGPGTALGSYMAGLLSYHIPELYLRVIFVVVMALLAWKTLWALPIPRKKVGWSQGSVLGVSVGGISGLTGTGAGIILSPLLLNWGGLKTASFHQQPMPS